MTSRDGDLFRERGWVGVPILLFGLAACAPTVGAPLGNEREGTTGEMSSETASADAPQPGPQVSASATTQPQASSSGDVDAEESSTGTMESASESEGETVADETGGASTGSELGECPFDEAGPTCGDPACADEPECACAFVVHFEHAYEFCGWATDRAGAAQACSQRGAFLITIDDAAENMWAIDVAATMFAGSWWSGLSDSETEGVFLWDDGTPFVYAEWFTPGEPSDSILGEDCVAQPEHTAYAWNDVSCLEARPFVCEAAGAR